MALAVSGDAFSFFSSDIRAAIDEAYKTPPEQQAEELATAEERQVVQEWGIVKELKLACKSGNLRLAEEILRTLKSTGHAPNRGTYLDLCQLYYESQQPEHAKQCFTRSQYSLKRYGDRVYLDSIGYFPAHLVLSPHLRELKEPYALRVIINRTRLNAGETVTYRKRLAQLIETAFKHLKVMLPHDDIKILVVRNIYQKQK